MLHCMPGEKMIDVSDTGILRKRKSEFSQHGSWTYGKRRYNLKREGVQLDTIKK